jgi:hypothetical protein
MRRVVLAASVFALIGLTACDSSSKDQEAVAPAAPKYFGRSQQMYAGQEMITKVDAAKIRVGKDGVLEMQADGSVGMAGYANPGFLPRINAIAPKDGVYEVDVVADRPQAAAAAPTPIEVKGAWDHYPADHLKGVKFIAKTNDVVVMLPAA